MKLQFLADFLTKLRPKENNSHGGLQVLIGLRIRKAMVKVTNKVILIELKKKLKRAKGLWAEESLVKLLGIDNILKKCITRKTSKLSKPSSKLHGQRQPPITWPNGQSTYKVKDDHIQFDQTTNSPTNIKLPTTRPKGQLQPQQANKALSTLLT
ncbi:hypothetical protein V8G54_008357 [Vigna mungo]|uniref:Uncharacterized protein n=1 Tax=Vigna mungo TaxID=3915 RepID=A0AAQ3P3N9_VIGMU